MRAAPVALLLVSLWTPAGAVAGAAIVGRVEVALDTRARGRRPEVAELGAGPPRDRPDRSRSVVYLESAPQAAFGPPPGRAEMDQNEETFVPYVLPITVGTTVDFPNSDPVYHNVFSLSRTRRFDLGRYARGHSKPVRFDRPGIVRVFCDIHSHMSAYILVFAHSFFAATGPDGGYRIEGVPPGRYTLVVWTDGEERSRREVTIPEGVDRVVHDFSVGTR
jgi:plastocyanin